MIFRLEKKVKSTFVKTSLEALIGMSEDVRDDPIAWEDTHLLELQEPQQALIVLGGSEFIESMQVSPLSGENENFNGSTVYEAVMFLSNLEELFKAYCE